MFVNKLKMDGIAEAVKKCMDEDDLEETGLRKAAYAAHTKGEKMFTFKGKTYPVKVQGEEVSYGEAVKEEADKDWDARNKEIKDAKQKIRGEIIAQKAAMKSKTQKEETEIDEAVKEEVEQVNEDNLDSIAKKHGMEYKRSTYGAKMTHPKHGEISINRYGEWHHYPAGSNSSKAHGDSSGNFSSLNKHLSSLKEEVEQISEKEGTFEFHRKQEKHHEAEGDKAMARAKSFGAYVHPTGISARKKAEKHYAKADEHRATYKAIGATPKHTVKEKTEIDEAASGEVTKTKTGLVHRSTKAYGGSKPEKHVVDILKGPKTKDLMKTDKESEMKTRGKYDEEMEFKNKLIEGYKVKKEELKGNQHKIDKNKNNKIDAQDFKILRAQQKEEVELDEASCEDEVKKHEKKMHGKDGEVAKHVDKMHKEDVEQIEEVKKPTGELKDACWKGYTAVGMKMKGGRKVPNCVPEEVELEEKEMTADDKAERERIVKGMKKGFAGFRQRYGKRAKDVMYATATKQAMKEESIKEKADPKVRTKDTLKGQEPTTQKDDVGPGSDGKSTKIKIEHVEEEVKKSDIPAFIRKARGDKPLTVADAKAGRKDSISSKENLAKARGVQEGKRPESDTVPFITDEQKPPFDKPYTTSPKTVKDKSGAKHTPMSRARDLARQAMKRIKTEMLGKAPGNNG